MLAVRGLALLLAAMSLVPSVFALAAQPEEPWLKRSMEAIRQAGEQKAEWMDAEGRLSPELLRQAEELAALGRERATAALRQQKPERGPSALSESQGPAQPRVVIFTTLGNPPSPAAIRRLEKALDGDPQVAILLRGLPVGVRRINQAMEFLARVDDGLEAPPGVFIDPRRFEDLRVEVAPTILYEDAAGTPVAWAQGVTDPDWLRRQVEAGRRGDLGVYGEVEEIAERSLLEEIRGRAMAVDWEEKKRQALGRFWANRPPVDLPAATGERVLEYAPEYQLIRDLRTPDGTVIAAAGAVFNSLDTLPGTFFLVVFDARDGRQVKLARQIAAEAPPGYRITFIATALRAEPDGWAEKRRIEEALGARLYLLDPALARTLRLQNIPASVMAVGNRIRIHEYPPEGF